MSILLSSIYGAAMGALMWQLGVNLWSWQFWIAVSLGVIPYIAALLEKG